MIIHDISKEKITHEIEQLSPSMIDDVLDFLYSLKNKRSNAESHAKQYDFSDLAGKLKWKGDAVAEQRKLRDEW